MKLEHSFTVPASVEETWEAFNDLERVVPCFPGATLSSFEAGEFTGSCKVKLGPISLLYNGSGQFVELDEDQHRAVLEAKGKDKRGNGTASATVTAQLASQGSTSTSVVVETDLAVTGKPAQFGRGVMQDVSDKMLGQFVDCLTTKLSPGTAEDKLEAATADAGAGPVAEPVTEPAGPVVEPVTEPAGAEAPPPTERPATGERRSDQAAGQSTPEVALDLGRTVLPVLAKRYGPYAVGVLFLLVLLRRILR